jgi:hypothetical protein
VALKVGLAAEQPEAMLHLPLDAGGGGIWGGSIWHLRLRARPAGERDQQGRQHDETCVSHDIFRKLLIDGVPIA